MGKVASEYLAGSKAAAGKSTAMQTLQPALQPVGKEAKERVPVQDALICFSFYSLSAAF